MAFAILCPRGVLARDRAVGCRRRNRTACLTSAASDPAAGSQHPAWTPGRRSASLRSGTQTRVPFRRQVPDAVRGHAVFPVWGDPCAIFPVAPVRAAPVRRSTSATRKRCAVACFGRQRRRRRARIDGDWSRGTRIQRVHRVRVVRLARQHATENGKDQHRNRQRCRIATRSAGDFAPRGRLLRVGRARLLCFAAIDVRGGGTGNSVRVLVRETRRADAAGARARTRYRHAPAATQSGRASTAWPPGGVLLPQIMHFHRDFVRPGRCQEMPLGDLPALQHL